jgi:hypothetical protein
MRLRFIGIVSVLAALLAVFVGVARALDFDDEDPHPPRAEIGLLYHYEIGTHAGCIPHHVSILSGQLPPGLKLTQIGYQTALVDGIATEAGTFSAWLAVRDCDNRSAETLFTFEVWDRRFGIDTKALPAASVGSAYSSTLTTWGISSNTTWAVTSGTLPAGLTLSKEGVISGTATAPGSSSFTVQATGVAKDFTGTRVDSHQYTLNVTALAASLSRPVGEVGIPLRTALVASGGQAPYSWSAAGRTPAGLTLGSDGSLRGVPARSGVYTLSAHLVDANGAAKDVTVRLVVRARLVIATNALRAAAAGHAYRAKLAVRGGVGPLSWTASLPRGLKLSRVGTITGIPAAAGMFRVKVRVRDSLGATSTKTLLLSVR